MELFLFTIRINQYLVDLVFLAPSPNLQLEPFVALSHPSPKQSTSSQTHMLTGFGKSSRFACVLEMLLSMASRRFNAKKSFLLGHNNQITDPSF